MRTQRELDGQGNPTGARWYAGRRIARCARHPRRWVVEEGGMLSGISDQSFPCGCFKKLAAAVSAIFLKARPEDAAQYGFSPHKPCHLKLVVSR